MTKNIKSNPPFTLAHEAQTNTWDVIDRHGELIAQGIEDFDAAKYFASLLCLGYVAQDDDGLFFFAVDGGVDVSTLESPATTTTVDDDSPAEVVAPPEPVDPQVEEFIESYNALLSGPGMPAKKAS